MARPITSVTSAMRIPQILFDTPGVMSLPGQLSLQLLALIIQGRKKERTQDAIFIPEVMVNRPHAGVAIPLPNIILFFSSAISALPMMNWIDNGKNPDNL